VAKKGSSVYFVSLGCPKNLVDSQVMLGMLREEKFRITDDPADAETIIVNTCSFIDTAKRESIETVFEMAEFKKTGRLKSLVMSGCLAQRYSGDLEKEMPEVDLFIGTGEYHRVASLLKQKALGKLRQRSFVDIPKFIHTDETPRLHTGLAHSAYLKVSEGCVRNCSFCIIPELRGHKVRSRSIDSLVKEAAHLAAGGVRELSLVAQDLTHFGIENGYKENLEGLLRELVKVDGIEWIRLHYAYPDNFTDGVIDLMATEAKIAKYVDMPLQHGDDKVLKLMNRRITAKAIRDLVKKMRARVPGIVFRTNMIVGHPGETEESYLNLKAMVKELEFERLGVFRYSLEEGTPSEKLAKRMGMIPEAIVKARHDEILSLQQAISLKKNQALVGKKLRVLVDGYHAETELLLEGRWEGQASGIDGSVLINDGIANPGEFVEIEISEALPYDLVGGIVENENRSYKSKSKSKQRNNSSSAHA
jgi:ribosomal protein S12 methylthiotransferase